MACSSRRRGAGTRQLLRHPTDVRLGIIPVLHALAATVVVNTVTDGGVDTTVLSGAVLGMTAVLLLIGMTRNDPVTGWLDTFALGWSVPATPWVSSASVTLLRPC